MKAAVLSSRARNRVEPYITLPLSSGKKRLPHVKMLNERRTINGRMGLCSQAELERVVTGVWGLRIVILILTHPQLTQLTTGTHDVSVGHSVPRILFLCGSCPANSVLAF